jgi:hypothetical protein
MCGFILTWTAGVRAAGGDLDATLNPCGGGTAEGVPRAIALQPGAKIIIGGLFTSMTVVGVVTDY